MSMAECLSRYAAAISIRQRHHPICAAKMSVRRDSRRMFDLST